MKKWHEHYKLMLVVDACTLNHKKSTKVLALSVLLRYLHFM